jgi:hypothetical protein
MSSSGGSRAAGQPGKGERVKGVIPWACARAASVSWVQRTLMAERRETAPAALTRAENFVAIAEHFNVPIDVLIAWIHTPSTDKAWSAAEWRRYCTWLTAEERTPHQIATT